MSTTTSPFTMSPEKIASVAAAGNLTEAAVREFCTDYDWSNAEDHAAWLETASAEEIASWIHSAQR